MNKTKLMLLGTSVAIIVFAHLTGSFTRTTKAAVREQANSGTRVDPPTVRPTKRALLVGINNYKYSDRISPLAGSLNDVADMRQILIGKFEFLPENIMVLEESQATHAGIMSAIQNHLIAKSQPGDIVVFHYSGHGSEMRDTTGRINALDETIVPYDSRDPEGKVFDISGAELHQALVQLASKTKNVTFTLDSCHSGTLVRGARVRFIPPDTRDIPASVETTMRGLSASKSETSPKFAFISATTSKENAFEHFADGKDHGALTYFLAQQLRSSGPGATYRDVMDGVISNVTANYPGQHPSIEGVEADQHVFGDGTSLAGAYAPASPSPYNPKRATLAIGQVQGTTVGSVYEVYAPGTKKFGLPERPTARVQVVSVDAFSSEATILGGGKVAPASRAIEREHHYGSSRARVYLEDVDKSPSLQSIKDALDSIKSIEIVDQPTKCNIQLRQVGQVIQTLAADSSTLSTPVSVSDPSATTKVLGQLQQWAKWLNVLAIRNSQAMIDVKLNLKGSQTRDPVGQVGRPDMGVVEGEIITTTLTNNSDRDLYVAILDLSGDGSISVIYPSQQGAKEVLKSGLVLSQSFPTFVPRGRSSVIDILKVFVSYKPIDLTPLTQGSIRGLEGTEDLDPIQELLMDSAGGTRGVGPLLTKPVDLGTWATVQRVLVVKRKR
jgi:Caspase domain